MKDRADLDQSYVGGFFDRQVRIEDWDQKKIEEATVLVLGVGGLGSVLVVNLLRLGIKKLIILDYDVVDIHNMNRQLLYSVNDIGLPKVECAVQNSKFHNVGKTEVVSFHGNALTNWKKVVEFVRESTFVFNCIDYGDKFDLAVSSLCIKLGKPLCMGGTFATSITVDYFDAQRPCYLCSDDTLLSDKELIMKISPDKI
jgi:molybdopterin/thiamine biosynthesis adenylyltransferase